MQFVALLTTKAGSTFQEGEHAGCNGATPRA